jgi:hypothetical protein
MKLWDCVSVVVNTKWFYIFFILLCLLVAANTEKKTIAEKKVYFLNATQAEVNATTLYKM